MPTARQIHGVRAVFGETYPDPVRVVSVGVPLSEILENVGDERWQKVSIEFCGGTHVQKTGDIKDLVILEENGIAKGIRRIVAVTGEVAHEAQRVASSFSDHLSTLEKMPFGPEKEQSVKQTQTDLNELNISAITKSELRTRFAKIHKDVLEAQKAKQKADSKAALEAVTKYFTDEENKDKKHLVLKLPVESANAKVISDVLNHVKTKEKDKAVYVFAADAITPSTASASKEGQDQPSRAANNNKEEEKKVAHGCYIGITPSSSKSNDNQDQKKNTEKVEASEWANLVASIVGGKAGGKGSSSQGLGREVERVDEAVQKAEEWIREKLHL